MGQYNTGTVNLRSAATSDIHGIGTAWAANISAGDLFKINGSDVIYQVSSVTGDSDLTLSSNYVGPVASGIQYQITRDFTPNYNFPEVHNGDVDWPVIVTQSLRDIDNELAINSGLVIALQSDVLADKADIIVLQSDVLSDKADIIVLQSDVVANRSDLIAARSDLFNAIQASLVAHAAGDSANVSDVMYTMYEVLVAMSDALPYS